jgi:hypothetical protein
MVQVLIKIHQIVTKISTYFLSKIQNIRIFLEKILDLFIILKNFDSKKFNDYEKFCYNLKPQADHTFYLFLKLSLFVFFLSFIVFTWPHLFSRSKWFLIHIMGRSTTYNIAAFIKKKKLFLLACKYVAVGMSLGFFIVLQLYQAMGFIIILNKMFFLFKNSSDMTEKFYIILITIFYILVGFIMQIFIDIFLFIIVFSYSS